jgi:hypothetical protein
MIGHRKLLSEQHWRSTLLLDFVVEPTVGLSTPNAEQSILVLTHKTFYVNDVIQKTVVFRRLAIRKKKLPIPPALTSQNYILKVSLP